MSEAALKGSVPATGRKRAPRAARPKPTLVAPTGADIAKFTDKPAPRSSAALSLSGNTIEFRYVSMEEAFPTLDCGVRPFGSLVLVQIRQPRMRTKGGILLTTEDRTTEHYNTQIAKVIAVGPIAFMDRKTREPWPEGAWAKPGDFIRVPKYQGDRIPFPYERPDFEIVDGVRVEAIAKDEAVFVLFKDLALLGAYTSDPLTVRAFL
jgi:co-chaperonin GroES (HSP10)